MELTNEQRRNFCRTGHVVLPGAIPVNRVERALGIINTDLGRGIDPARIGEFYRNAALACSDTVKAGDLLLAHYQLGHAAAPNLSARVRYAVFFRLYHRDHDSQALDILADTWREYPGLTELAGEPDF